MLRPQDDIGPVLNAGDKSGVWDWLREAKMISQAALDIVGAYLAGDALEPLTESLAFDNWGAPLVSALELACQGAVGDHAACEDSHHLFPVTLLLLRPVMLLFSVSRSSRSIQVRARILNPCVGVPSNQPHLAGLM
jgi:hypothetical protein